MLQTGDYYKYSQFPDKIDKEYKLSPADVLGFQLYSNDGFKLIDIVGGGASRISGVSNSITVEFDGMAKLPVLGRVNMKGLTLREAERFLEDKYAQFYNKPFVYITVTNKRVIIFAGGRASVVSLKHDNETLFEALADFGGLPDDGKADKIKLIRGDLKNPDVYLIDLSTLNGVKNADLVMQGNDIIYIETRKNIVSKTIAEISPYLTALSTALLIYSLIISNVIKIK